MPPTSLDHAVIGENRPFQNRFWFAQRVAWVLLAALLVASLLGLTGGTGPLAHRTITDSAVSIDYPAILRRHAPSAFTLTLAQPLSDTLVHVDRDFLRVFSITAMTPPPLSSYATSSGVAYHFAFQGTGPARLRLDVVAARPAHSDYRIVTNGRMALLTSTVLP